MLLLRRVHQLAVGLVVPPHEAQVAVHDVGAGMDVADDALAAGNGERELVARSDGRARSWEWSGRARNSCPDCRSGHKGPNGPASDRWRRSRGRRCSRWSGSRRRWSLVPRKFSVGSSKPGLLQAEEDGIGAIFGAQAAIAQAGAGPAGFVFAFRGCRSPGETGRRARRSAGCCRAGRSRTAAAGRDRRARPCAAISSTDGGGTV